MSLSPTFLFLFLQSSSVLCNFDISHCPLFMKPRVFSDGDLLLDGFFPIYKLNFPREIEQLSFLHKSMERFPEMWDWSNYQYVLAFLFAIEEINKSTYLLPNLTLGFSIYNAVELDHKTLENILIWFSGGNQIIPNYNCQKQKVSVAIIAGTHPQFLTAIGSLLELYRFPQVSYGPFDSILSDKDQFPSLYQVATKDNSLVHGLVCLLQHFDWTWLGFLASDNIKVDNFLKDLQAEVLKKDICFYFTLMFFKNWLSTITYTMILPICQYNLAVNVTIVYGKADIFNIVHFFATFCSLSGRMWIMVIESHIDLQAMKNTMGIFHGSLSFLDQKREVPGFEHFVKTLSPSKHPEDFYTVKFWLDTFNCSYDVSLCLNLNECPPNSSIEFMPDNTELVTMSESSYNIYNAVHAVTRALHEMLLEKTEVELTTDTNQGLLFSWKLHSFLRNTQLTNNIGDHLVLDGGGNTKKKYDILNIGEFPVAHGLLSKGGANGFMAKVGEFMFLGSNNQNLVIDEEIIEWPAGLKKPPTSMCTQRCGPGFKKITNETKKCCFKCVFCPNGEISKERDSQQCIQCSDQEYSNEERTHCLPKMMTYLAFEDFYGMALSCTALCFSGLTAGVLWVFMKNRDTPIVKANNRTLSYILLISLFLCFLCSFLFIGRPNTVTCILQQVTFAAVFTVAISTVLAKTITVILAFKAMRPGRTMRWLLVSGAPNYVIPICTVIQVIICGIWVGLSSPFIDIDAHSEPRHVLIVCNKGSVTAFYCVLGYLGSLALVSFSLSYLVRNLPDTFNEAKFLTFSMLVFCSIWVTFLPVYHSAQGKAMVTSEVFSILASSAGLLVCIFAPKCYIILIKPDKNSLKKLRNKMGPW